VPVLELLGLLGRDERDPMTKPHAVPDEIAVTVAKPSSPAHDKLKLAKRVISQLEHLSGAEQSHLMGVVQNVSDPIALRKVLSILETAGANRVAVVETVSHLVGKPA
jgi:hypothetical protein